MAVREFKLPDPGEGLTEAEIVTWHVKPGDTVKVNDVIVEVETAKSLVELPVPFAGTVSALHVAEGDTVEVGTSIISIDDGGARAADAARPPPRPPRTWEEGEAHRRHDLDGAHRRARRLRRQADRGQAPPGGSRSPDLPGRRRHPPRRAPPGAAGKPPVRKLAKDLGVDLGTVAPTGDGGVVTRADVEAAAGGPPRAPLQTSPSPVSARPGCPSRACAR